MWRAYLLVLAVAVVNAHEAAAGQSIGTAAIVQNTVTGTPENATAALMRRGDNVFANERVATAKDSKAQLLFVDQSALSIAPESTIVLDKFVYNPETNAGTVILNTVSGAFRFIGGVADTRPGSSYKVQTPAGTIGIRGTMFEWSVKGDYLWALLRQGKIQVCVTNNQCETLNKPGTYLVTRGTQLSAIRYWKGPGSDGAKSTDPDDLYLTYVETLRAALPSTTSPAQLTVPAEAPPPPSVTPPSVTPPPVPPPFVRRDCPPFLTRLGIFPRELDQRGDAQWRLPPRLAFNHDPNSFLPPGRPNKH